MDPIDGAPEMARVHRSLDELERGFHAFPPPPRAHGRVALIVCRDAPGVHRAMERVLLTPEEGVPGDEWNRRLPRSADAQLAVMRRDVAELIANGQPLTVFGDNLFVELDLSTANLPTGTRLRVGEAILTVTPKAHNGCAKFSARFGQDAVRFVQAPGTRHQNLRGVYWRVLEPGEVSVGSPIEIVPAKKQ